MMNINVEPTKPTINSRGKSNNNSTENVAIAKQTSVSKILIQRLNKRVSISVNPAATTPKVSGITNETEPKYHGTSVEPVKLISIRILNSKLLL